MNMSRKMIVIGILILLTACSSTEKVDDAAEEKVDEAADKENMSEVEEITNNSDVDNVLSAENNTFSLKEIDINRLNLIRITEKDGNRILFDDYLSSTEIVSETEAVFSDEYYDTVRNSSQALYCDGFDEGFANNLIDSNISDMEFVHFDSSVTNSFSSFESPYNLIKKNTVLVLEGTDESSEVNVKDIVYGYCVDNITLNCFIRRNTSDTFDVIIDPAYMYGLPVYHSDAACCGYTVNGLNVKADTLFFNVADVDGALNDTLMRSSSSYVYAQLTFGEIDCSYGVKSGYNITASIDDYKLITTDTERVLTKSYIFDGKEGKNPEMLRIYNTLMSNMDVLNTESTLGITLLDLDFDNTPEVLATRYSDISDPSYTAYDTEAADVDIYRIENENLIYIGTLYNYHTVIYELGNVLGLKILEDGSKAWFNMSYRNRNTGEVSDTDYIFTLEGNELKFQEVFSKDKEGNYYYFGEPMVFEESPFTHEIYGQETTTTMYSWGNYKSIFGTWELIGKIKQGYCEDMKDSSFNLYSDWLSHTEPNNKSYKLQLTERMISYNVAYLVDSYYLGSYDANKQYFEYRFLGDYAKPVIYLYPTKQEDVSVKIELKGMLTCSYPEYNDGWNVTAYPDGTLINKSDGREYSYLYWEGKGAADWDMSQGFVVKGSDTARFLQDKLEYLGLTSRELNEFIVYWLPLMKDNKYNLITFQTAAYENNANLYITPKPDSVLRVFMAYKALDDYIEVSEQRLGTFMRNGFTAVEWGGTEVK